MKFVPIVEVNSSLRISTKNAIIQRELRSRDYWWWRGWQWQLKEYERGVTYTRAIEHLLPPKMQGHAQIQGHRG
eukprot:COSAG05_NODE_122_length_17611_cov_47.044655_14_plen_74_part_00